MNKQKLVQMSGKDHPAYKTGKGKGYRHALTRKLITKWVCEHCSAKDMDKLVAHHKDKNPRNNTVDNLQVLCKSCHTKYHWITKRIKLQARRLERQRARQQLKIDVHNAILEALNTDKYYRAKELEKMLGCTRERIRQVREEGYLKYIKVKGAYYYALPPLKSWYIYERYTK